MEQRNRTLGAQFQYAGHFQYVGHILVRQHSFIHWLWTKEMPWICLSPKCSPTDPLCPSRTPAPNAHSFNSFGRAAFFDVLLSSRTKGSYKLQAAKQWNPHEGSYFQWCWVLLNNYSPKSFSGGGSGGIRVSSRTNETIDALNSNDMAEKSLFRKPWAASIGTHLHNPHIFSKVLVTSKHAATSCTNV